MWSATAPTEHYTLSLHDALPIWGTLRGYGPFARPVFNESLLLLQAFQGVTAVITLVLARSEEHTSELQSHSDLVCRLLLEKKNNEVHDRTAHKARTGVSVLVAEY